MSWLRKLLPNRGSHEEWLAKHPGKESTTNLPVVDSEDEQQATRKRMEDEMDIQRGARNRP